MNTLPESLALTTSWQAAGLLVGAAIFLILFTVILTTLRRAGACSSGVNVVLAICVSLLAVIGLIGRFGRGPDDQSGPENRGRMDFILLPYTAMAIAMLLVLLLLLFRRIVAGGRWRLPRPRWDHFRGGLEDVVGHGTRAGGDATNQPDPGDKVATIHR